MSEAAESWAGPEMQAALADRDHDAGYASWQTRDLA